MTFDVFVNPGDLDSVMDPVLVFELVVDAVIVAVPAIVLDTVFVIVYGDDGLL